MGSAIGKGGSTQVQGVNPYDAARADFLYNRPSQYTPNGNLIFTAPGQQGPAPQQTGFLPTGMTGQAMNTFFPQAPTPTGGKSKGGGSTTQGGVPSQFLPQYGGTQGGQGGKGGGKGTMPTPAAPDRAQASGRLSKGGRLLGGGQTQTSTTGNATATQQLPAAVLALENARTTASANTLADALGRQQAISNGGLPALTSSLNTSGLPSGQAGFTGLPATPDSIPQFTNQTIQAMFQLGAEPLNRQFGRMYDQTEQSLANKGLAYPGEAASRQMSDLYREQSQAMQNLALQSVLAGGQEASRSLGDILNTRGQLSGEQQATFGQNEAQRQARLGEQVQNAGLAQGSRTQQLNELNTLLGLPQVNAPPIQSFLNTSPTNMMDAFGLNQNAQIANANTNTNMKGSKMGGLGQLGSAALMGGIFSDRRLKTNVSKIGRINGINIYAYEIGGVPSVGVMADEVPWAAMDHPSGYQMVDYGRVF